MNIDLVGKSTCIKCIFTRLLPGLEAFSYKERFDRLGLFSLECEGLRRNLIEVYKITQGVDSQEIFPKVGLSNTRGKFYGDKFVFLLGVAGVWNTLPAWVMVKADVSETELIILV